MQPSISVTLEPGSERVVPWGRDLYTFVTSAAGHMMRTLQKPRKNRPSKRQVNHRRFLHNMIQRKFADIEAANHRLASALYFNEEEKNISSMQSQKPETSDQNDHLQNTEEGSTSNSRTDVGSHQTEVSGKKQSDSGNLWKQHPKSQSPNGTTGKNNQSSRRQRKESGNHKLAEFSFMSSPKGLDYYHGAEGFHTEYYEDNSLKPHSNLSEQTALQDSGISPSFSSEPSVLSFDSCDLSIQMFTDISTYTHSQRSIADVSESQWADVMDLFSEGNNDLGGCMDVEAYFESICVCPGGVGHEGGGDDMTFSDQSGSFTERICNNRSEAEELHCERGEYRYECAYSCHGDQGLTVHQTAERQFNNLKSSQGSDIAQNQLLTSINYYCNVSELQTCQHPQEDGHYMRANCEHNTNFTPFEGIAQSFSAPLHNSEQRPVPTPPHEDDWLFTDILVDRKSPDS